MFKGTIPQSVRAMLFEAAAGWKVNKLAVACSGNFTIERVFASRFAEIRSCDVTIYSCAMGAFFAGKPFRLELRPEVHEDFDWLLPGLDTPARSLATLMQLTQISDAIGKDGKLKINSYYTRMIGGYRRQWAAMLEKTAQRLEATPLKLADYYAGDAVDWLPTIPPDNAVISFPPFFGGDYEQMFSKLEALFDWDKATYQELFEERRQIFLSALTGREFWAIGSSKQLPEFENNLRGLAQTSNRGTPIYVYASEAPRRIVTPVQQTTQVCIPRLTPGEQIGDKLQLLPLQSPQFRALRSQYMNAFIKPGSESASYGVVVDDKLIGVFAFMKAFRVPGVSADTMYLLSDFPVAPTDYPRLSKLVLYAALSREAQILAERISRQRVRQIMTTAFSHNPVSMKYRGLFKVVNRSENPGDPGNHRYKINYIAPAGAWNLQEGLKLWKQKHGSILAQSE